MIRFFALLICLLVTIGQVFADRAIVFISPSAAGPVVSPETVSHPLWVTWPEPTDGSGVNQLVAIVASGEPTVSSANFRFQPSGPHQFINRANETLAKFLLPNSFWGGGFERALSVTGESVDQGILAMCACADATVEVADHIGGDDKLTYLARVTNWEDVAKVSRLVKEQTLVVEFPPPNGSRFSKVWIFRHGKVVPDAAVGVIAATDLDDLLIENEASVKNGGGSMRSGPPDRWLDVGSQQPIVRISLYVLVWIAVLVSLVHLSQEKSKLASRASLYTILSLFFALQAFPILCRWSGIGLWWFWTALLTAGALVAFLTVDRNAAPGSRNGFALAASLMLLVTSAVPFHLSPFSATYSLSHQFETAIIAFRIFMAAMLFLTMRGESGPGWALSMAAFPLLIFIVSSVSGDEVAFASFLVFFVLLRRWWSYGLALVAFLFMVATGPFEDGLAPVWRSYETIQTRSNPVNYFEFARQLMKPEFAVLLIALLLVTMLASRFGAHRMQKAWREVPAVRILCVTTGIVFLSAFIQPAMLGALPWMLAFAYLFWTQEAIRQLN